MDDDDKMTYAKSGVDYEIMDAFKRAATLAAMGTAKNLHQHGATELAWTRGESAYLLDIGDRYLALVEEGLGTKNLVADELYARTGALRYGDIAQDTVAMIVNDMATLNVPPLAVAMHLAAGRSDWFEDGKRYASLIAGWKKACDLAECAWGGGETPALKGLVDPASVVLSGSAIGMLKDKSRVLRPDKIRDGDAIIILESNGIHANGLTLARDIAAKTGYDARTPNGRSFGEALLDPTPIYGPFVRRCVEWGADVHYAVNVTGHGWRKLMRAPQSLAYIIDSIPTPQPIFDFIQTEGDVDEREMYGTYNMGAGFVLYVPDADVKKVWDVFHHFNGWGFGMVWAGHVFDSTEKKVVIKPKGITFTGDELKVR